MNSIAAWFRSKNITTHTVGAAVFGLAGIIATDRQVQQYVVQLFVAHPALAAQIIGGAVIIAKYSHSSSPAGTLATARAINDSPNAPTRAQVDAAQGK